MKTKLLSILVLTLCLGFISSCNKEECPELFKEGCDLDTRYRPVCGCNGKTYANKTYAECAGVEYIDGECLDQQ